MTDRGKAFLVQNSTESLLERSSVSSVRFSIIVPVFHEGDRINDLMEHLNQLDTGEACEIIIVDGAPERDTLKRVQSNHVIKVSSEKGRAMQMNAGASVAKGEILIFLHADTELPHCALKRINDFLPRKEYVGGAFDLGIKSDKPIFKVIAFLASLRSRLNRIPFGDQGIFVRREYFNDMGGYKQIPLMEDVEFMRRIRKSGKKIKIFYDRVMTSPRRWEREGVLYCTLRNYTNQLLFSVGVSPHKLANWY
jgi:rSAM/selenodomain-associated transferase 2